MFQYVIGLVCIASLMVSCGPNETIDPYAANCPSEGECTHDLFPFSSLRWHELGGKVQGLEREPGDATVFHYTYTLNDNPQVADDEYKEEIWLEIPGDPDSFTYENDEIPDLHFFFRQSCFCPGTDWVAITGGKISGKLLDDGAWGLTLEITFQNLGIAEARTITGTFR